MKNKIIEIINDTMEIDCAEIDHDTPFENLSEWDSFNGLMLVTNFQDEFEIEFTAQEIESVKTINNIITLVEQKIAKKKDKNK